MIGRPFRSVVLVSLVAARSVSANASAEEPAPTWEWGPSLALYVVGDEEFLQPTLTVNRGGLHLEGRYNYEALQTGSAFVGWNFSFGEELRLGLTPMVGGVFGNTNGVAPGLTWTLDWGRVAFWSQSEYVFDFAELSQSFFYNWSELSAPTGYWFRIGAVLQRTRVFQTRTQVQAGPFIGISLWKLAATTYLFAPGQDDQFFVFALAVQL